MNDIDLDTAPSVALCCQLGVAMIEAQRYPDVKEALGLTNARKVGEIATPNERTIFMTALGGEMI